MSDEKEKLTIDNFLKKVQKGDNTLLIIGAIIMIVPIVALSFLAGGKTNKKPYQQELKRMTKRKNVFSFSKKDDSSSNKPVTSSSLPRSSSSSSSSGGWFSSTKTPKERVADELEEASRIIERKSQEVVAPSSLHGHAREYFLAEHNYNLSMGNGALESKKYEEAERYLYKALEEAEGNPFLTVFALGSICALYERTGDKKKMEEAYKQYIDAVSKIPPEYGGMDLKSTVRTAYKTLESVGKYASESELSTALSKNPMVNSGKVPSNVNVREVYKDFPVKYE